MLPYRERRTCTGSCLADATLQCQKFCS
jgi:hypothetical protein